jgi:hypothetical protein
VEVKIKQKIVHLTLAVIFSIFHHTILEDYTMEQQATAQEPATVSSFMTRATNVFMSPGELYAEVAQTPPQTSSWLIPMILAMVLSAVFTYVIFSNPAWRHQMMDPRIAEMQEQVTQGKMTQEQFDRASEFMESSNVILYSGLIGSLVAPPIILLLAALVLWLVLKFMLKSSADYKKAMELYGLATLVGLLGVIISLILIHVFDSVHATASGALLVLNSFDPKNFAHKLFASLTVFGIWQTAVVGIGLGKISGKPQGTGLGVAFGLWAVMVILSAVTGFGIL